MAVSFVAGSTNQSITGTQTPTIGVPAGLTEGDLLIAVCVCASDLNMAAPAGWNVAVDNLVLSSGHASVIWRRYTSGVVDAAWLLDTSGVYGKSAMSIAAYRGAANPVFGTGVNRGTSTTATVIPAVTTLDAASWLVAVAVDRVSSQTSVTGPGSMTERAKVFTGGGGGVSSYIGDEVVPTAGATGTRTVTYGVASASGFGIAAFIPPTPNQPPSVTCGAAQNVAAGATVTVTSAATDPDGSVASRQWSFDYPTSGAPALTNATSANASFTAGAAGSLYILRHTATDDAGATASATTEVRVPVTGAARHLPVNGTGVGTWTRYGAATTDGAALSDELGTTGVESPALSVSASTRRVRLQPMVPRTGLQLSETLSLNSAGSHTVRVRLYEGSALRQEWVVTDLTTTDTARTFTVTNPGAIGDWGNLFVEVSATS